MSFDLNLAIKILLVVVAIAILVVLIIQYQKKNENNKNVQEDFRYPAHRDKKRVVRHYEDFEEDMPGKERKYKEDKMKARERETKDREIKEREKARIQKMQREENHFPEIVQPVKASESYNDKMPAFDSMSKNENDGVKPTEDMNNDDYKAVDFEVSNQAASDCYPRDRLTTDDLLPKDAANSKWADANPAGQGDVKDQNYLQAGVHFGINTVGESLRNANMQLRSDPPIPKIEGLSPWNNTTIEYDSNRRFFEIGSV